MDIYTDIPFLLDLDVYILRVHCMVQVHWVLGPPERRESAGLCPSPQVPQQGPLIAKRLLLYAFFSPPYAGNHPLYLILFLLILYKELFRCTRCFSTAFSLRAGGI